MYKLKSNQPAFQVMSGPFARQRFEHGASYPQVPDRYRNRFEEIREVDEEDSAAAPEETVDPEESEEQGEMIYEHSNCQL
ncbi:hypothetical protein [Desulfobacter vibrioformis]|uniref:hypothetical protein n=1 Tax=Desulfobacter vibrioformis TaxID=34031 RepID=UPI000557EACE|nr:hypothetical protein [Desulfobacter vibrioformis]